MRVRKGRIEVIAFAIDAFSHCAFKSGLTPATDSAIGVRRDIGAVDCPEGRKERMAASVGRAALRCMATRAVAELCQGPAFAQELLISGLLTSVRRLNPFDFGLPDQDTG